MKKKRTSKALGESVAFAAPHSVKASRFPRAGWNLARPRSLPGPSLWPAGVALGVTIMAWSIVTSAIVGAIGGLFFAVSLGNWIAEALRDEEDD